MLHARQLDAGYALEALQAPLQNAVEQVVAVRQVSLTGDAQLQDRLVTQRPGEDKDPANVVGEQVANCIHLGPRLDTLCAHALVPAELQEYLGLAFARAGEHALDTGQGGERLFHGTCNEALDLLRR